MATAFTHALVGASLATTAAARKRRLSLAVALAILAVAPDLDVAAFALGIPYEHPLGHRGFTHSLPFAALAGVAVAWVFFRRPGAPVREWWRVAALLAIATASHGFLDAFTDAGRGIGFFIPFDDTRYFFPWRPLATSPIGIERFFEGPALRILTNEVLWVWVPFGAALAALRVWQRRG